MNGYLGAMRRYASFSGRASRGEFWWFTLLATVFIFVALIVDAAYISGPESRSQVIAKVVILLHALPSLAVSVRRLHDTDRSGWLLLVTIVPLIGTILMIVWACQAGTSGPNRFGPDPLNGRSAASGNALVPPPSPAPRDLIEEIERLAQLKASGSISESEFEVLKAQALARG